MKNLYNWIIHYAKRLEAKSSGRSKPAPQSSRSSEERTKKTNGRLDASGSQAQIPDPWDDPLM